MTVILRTQKNHRKKRTAEKTARLFHYKRRNFVKRLVSREGTKIQPGHY